MHSSTTTIDCHRITWKVENDMVSLQFWDYCPKLGNETIIHQVITFKPKEERYSFPMCRFKPKAGEWKNYFVIMQTEEKTDATADTAEGTQAESLQCEASKGQ